MGTETGGAGAKAGRCCAGGYDGVECSGLKEEEDAARRRTGRGGKEQRVIVEADYWLGVRDWVGWSR